MVARRILVAALALAGALQPAHIGAASVDPASGSGASEAVGGPASSLQSDLRRLAEAIRSRDVSAITSHFADDLVADGFPPHPAPLRAEVKWIASHGWVPGNPQQIVIGGKRPVDSARGLVIRPVDARELLRVIATFLGHFKEIEDVRFEVGDMGVSDRAAGAVEALLELRLEGRDPEGRREQVQGSFEIEAVPSEGRWLIRRWHTASLLSEVATTEIFSEVSAAAGLGHAFPAFGVAPNDRLLAQGGAAGDVDGDGLMDLLLTGMDGARLFVNDGRGGFRDVSESTRLARIRRPSAATFLDFDQDGDNDIFMSSVGRQMLFESRIDPNGILRFHDVSEQAGVAVEAVGGSIAVADVNMDGLSDIYVTSSNLPGQVVPDSWVHARNGTPNLLFVSIGSGRFRESARVWGVDDGRWSMAAAFADANGDGWLDLYVANEFGEDALFISKRTRFEDEAARRGVADAGDGKGVAWGDYDNDGDLDLHVSNTSSPAAARLVRAMTPGPDAADGAADGALARLATGNSLYANRGNGWFTDATREAGSFRAGWAWGGGFIDIDNDGWEDLLTVNGFVSGRSMIDGDGDWWSLVAASASRAGGATSGGGREGPLDPLWTDAASLAGRERDCLYLGLGNGSFREMSGVSGIDSASDGRGAIFVDLDNDGDQDVVTTAAQGKAWYLYRNNVGQKAGFLRVTLRGTRSGPDAFGSVVRLKTSRGIQTKTKSGGSGYLSVHDPRVLFGLGEDESAEWLEVTWPSGLKQRAGPIKARDSLRIVEGSETIERVDEKRFSLPDPAPAAPE